jgi:UDP-N-acetylglucosamine 2-epimerase
MTTTDIRVVTIVGTRPEIIRLSRVIARLDDNCHHVLVHTGQNYDRELSAIFFTEMGIREPDYNLSVDTSTVGRMIGDAIGRTEEVLARERPDAVLVLGDTNSALASLIAKRMGITVFHMEAGNRCFDANVPEEVNRRVIDHFADINLAYTEHARRNLLAEGIESQRIYLTGSPLREVLDHYAGKIDSSTVLTQLGVVPEGFFLLSMHREENVDDPSRLRELLDAVEALSAYHDLPVLASVHPRTLRRTEELKRSSAWPSIKMLPPFGYFDYICLQRHARCVISDSGTVSEEAAMLGFPAVTIRDSIERPEAMDSGAIMLAGITSDGLRDAVGVVLRSRDEGEIPDVPIEYTIKNCSQRVANLVIGLSRLHPIWDGLRRPKREQAR